MQTLSVHDAAKKLRVSRQQIFTLIWAGKLPATKVNRQWQVDGKAVAARLQAKKARVAAMYEELGL